jgi:hypothetical protein
MLSYGNDFSVSQLHRQPLPFDANDPLTSKNIPTILSSIESHTL